MLDDMISSTLDWISLSVMRLMWPLFTFFSQICSGFEPIEYRIDRNPDWKVFLNMVHRSACSDWAETRDCRATDNCDPLQHRSQG